MNNDQTTPLPSKNQIVYTRLEENINRVSHLVGACLAGIGGTILIVRTALVRPEPLAIVAVCLYSLFLIVMYLMSTLYHFQPTGKIRRAVFRRLDHCAIPLLIAGTYCPLMLIGLGGPLGIFIASSELAIAILLVTFSAINVHKFRIFNLIGYLLMGWLCVFALVPFYEAVGMEVFGWLLAGGVIYTIGVVFYRIKKIKLNHAIWHFFVLLGSILQYVAILVMIG